MESKGAFAKAFQKTITRTKAKVLQNLGKAEKTTDDGFEDHVANFTKQQAMAARLQKEVKHYVQCVRAMTAASKNLYTVIKECYEPEWIDLHTVDSAIRSLDMLCSNYEAELYDRVCSDLNTYVELFSPMKEKISKRRRKLLDYDNAKHSYEGLLSAKKQDEMKMAKAYESLQDAERLYHDLNTELHRELPKFHSYRIDFISSNLSRLYSTESTFHTETGKITNDLHDLMESIPRAEDRAMNNDTYYSPLDHTGLDLSNLEKSVHSVDEPSSSHGESGKYIDTQYPPQPNDVGGGASAVSELNVATDVDSSQPVSNGDNLLNGTPSAHKSPTKSDDGDTILLAESAEIVEYDMPSSPVKVEDTQQHEAGGAEDESVYENTATLTLTQSDVVAAGQQVLATHKYTAQDDDELSFEPGEIMDVVEFDDPDDEDEGWLMGVSRSTGRRGVFPQNFTKKIIGRKLIANS